MSDERSLRDALEQSQQENKRLRRLVAELEALNPHGLLERVKELQERVTVLVHRLDRADEVREAWHRRTNELDERVTVLAGRLERADEVRDEWHERVEELEQALLRREEELSGLRARLAELAPGEPRGDLQ